eukprot:scaffold48767_cov67-Cyclotella_meneghiniana.AAC.6
MLIKPVLLHFKFDGFADLPSGVDSHVYSDVQTDCNGDTWKLKLYPGGNSAAGEQGWIGVFLIPVSRNEEFGAAFSLITKNTNGIVLREIRCDHMFQPRMSCGFKFMKRDMILDANNNILKDGVLRIDARIQVKDKKDSQLFMFQSKLSNKMMTLLESGEKADASFEVGDSTFPVHSIILHNNASILANHLVGGYASSAVIDGITAAVFQMVLAYVYAERLPTDGEMLEHGKELIDAADRYELVDLKMAVEHVLVRERILTPKNVSDYIQLADAKSCPLLKEYATTFLYVNAEDVLNSELFKLVKDVIEENARKRRRAAVFQVVQSEFSKVLKELDAANKACDTLVATVKEAEAVFSRLKAAKRQRTE